ncbi:MAG: EF-hand domain-containing protein [Sphingomonadaceae bacterium]|jgi:Ca2+-binding EF-hand superfamily protein
MNRMTYLGMALAVSISAAPAIAQQAAAPADPAPASTPASADAAATPASANAEQVAALVDKDFPTYDADKSGQLDKAEFSKWVLALKDSELKASGKTMAQADLAVWASAAFKSADSDKNTTVSKTEMGKFLGA